MSYFDESGGNCDIILLFYMNRSVLIDNRKFHVDMIVCKNRMMQNERSDFNIF